MPKCVVFSGIITWKDKKHFHKNGAGTNNRLKNFCSEKKLDFFDNSNIKEDGLGIYKLHLDKTGILILQVIY